MLTHSLPRAQVRTSLGQLGFVTTSTGTPTPLSLGTIRDSRQHLDLWSGVLSSNFSVGQSQRVRVRTVADNASDTIAVRYTAPATMGLSVQLAFCAPGTVPIGTTTVGNHTQPGNGGMQACDWLQPLDSHTTSVIRTKLSNDLGSVPQNISETWAAFLQ